MKKKNQRNIRLCFFIPYGLLLFKEKSLKVIGGAEVQLYLVSEYLAKEKNFEVNIILGDYNLKKKKSGLLRNKHLYITYPLGNKFLNSIKRPLNLFITLLKIKPDLVIQRTASINTGLCALFCKFFKKKFIFSIANKPNVNGEDEKGYAGKIFRYGLEHADFIIAQNYEQIVELETYKKRRFNNIKVIRSGYQIKDFDKSKKEFILWVGRALRWKRPELFLKVAQKFPKQKFVMILNKAEDLAYWNILYEKSSKIPNFEFIEFVPFHKINDYFKKAKIFVNTSKYEGFPNTFLQAFNNKTPVISLSVDPDNILKTNKIGFSTKNDFNEMEKKLRILLENHDLYDTYSNNAFNYVTKNHDIKRISQEWTNIIEEILY